MDVSPWSTASPSPCTPPPSRSSRSTRCTTARSSALAFGDVQAFVNATESVSTPRPPTTARVVALNQGPFVGSPPQLEHLAQPGDATILDVRPADAHAAGHVHGALNVPVSGSS